MIGACDLVLFAYPTFYAILCLLN